MMHVWEEPLLLENKKVCKFCKLDEEVKTEECPGHEVTEEEKKKIQAQLLDFKRGKWRTYMKLF